MSCKDTHTSYQPRWEEMECPECGNPELYVEPVNEADYNCELLHANDLVFCTACGFQMEGEEFAEFAEKQDKTEVCPHCKGTGRIQKK